MHIGHRMVIWLIACLGAVSPVLAEGFFEASVVAEDLDDWPTVRLLLGVHDLAATTQNSEGWDSGADRFAHGLGPVPVRTFAPEPTEDRFCPDRDPETGRRVCWMIEMTHEGRDIADIRQISLPMIRNLGMLYLWIEYEMAQIKQAPAYDRPHEITIYLESLAQGNRTKAFHPPLHLHGTSVEFSLADGPWAHLRSETEKAVTWMMDGYAELAESSEHEALLYEAHARWEESREADCAYRTHFVSGPEVREALFNECMYEHAVLRLTTYERLVEGRVW